VVKTTSNKTFKLALAKLGQASVVAKAPSFSKPGLAR